MLAGCIIACSTNKDITDEVEDIPLNIEFLFAQPLDVIQKCMEGEWKLTFIDVGLIGEDRSQSDEYMILTRDRIIMKNDVYRNRVDSPIVWETIENHQNFPLAHYIAYNHHIDYDNESDEVIISYHVLIPQTIRDGTLILWDFNSTLDCLYRYKKRPSK